MTAKSLALGIVSLLTLFSWVITSYAETSTYQNTQSNLVAQDGAGLSLDLQKYTLKQNIQVGIDHWAGNFANPNTLAFLDTPNSGSYPNIIPWLKFSGSYLLSGNNDVLLNLDYSYNNLLGSQLDQANVDFAITPVIRARIGVVPMRLNFCRKYEQDDPWIMEVSVACGYGAQSTYRATNAAPGIQVYLNSQVNDWLSSYQIGFYQPALLGYDTTEFGYFRLTPNSIDPGGGPSQSPASRTNSNSKFSLSYHGLNSLTGIEVKLAGLWAVATTTQASPSTTNAFGEEYSFGSASPGSLNTNRYQIFFSSIRFPVGKNLMITPTYLFANGNLGGNINGNINIIDGGGIDPNGLVIPYQYDPGISNTRIKNMGVEFKYGLSNNDSISAYIGASQVSANTIVGMRSDVTAEPLPGLNNLDIVKKTITSIAYRKDLESGFFYIIQGVYGWVSTTTTFTQPIVDKGGFLGLRLGYLFH